MQTFIDSDPTSLEHDALLAWVSTPGRFGALVLGAKASDVEGETWFGDEDGPEPPEDGPEDGWETLAAHHGLAGVDEDGCIDRLDYSLRVLTPTPMCFQPEPPPNQRVDALFGALRDTLVSTLGKPTRRTKKTVEFEWEDGGARIERSVERMEPWDRVGLEVAWWGKPPAATPRTAAPGAEAPVERPDAAALKEELQSVLPDCFDCGMRVTTVEVSGDAAPYTVDIAVTFDPYTGEDVEDSVTIEVDDPAFDVCTAAIEAMGELVDEHR
ncbi:MAG: hypothetical protein AAF721_25585 [Myxococcota bacterium]